MKDCTDTTSFGIQAPATPNGVDYGDCRNSPT
jgi:hypothetical protein